MGCGTYRQVEEIFPKKVRSCEAPFDDSGACPLVRAVLRSEDRAFGPVVGDSVVHYVGAGCQHVRHGSSIPRERQTHRHIDKLLVVWKIVCRTAIDCHHLHLRLGHFIVRILEKVDGFTIDEVAFWILYLCHVA